MSQILKLAQLAHGDGMPQMQISGSGIVSAIDAQRPASFFSCDQAFAKFIGHGFLQFFIAIFRALHQ